MFSVSMTVRLFPLIPACAAVRNRRVCEISKIAAKESISKRPCYTVASYPRHPPANFSRRFDDR
jgi:hypothetical protein